MVWHQCTVDIFLIDWERSRGMLLTTNQNPESIATPTTATAPVSIWRTYFVANEWNEIQSRRKLNPTLLLLLVLLFLNVSCMGYVSLPRSVPVFGLGPEVYALSSLVSTPQCLFCFVAKSLGMWM